MVWVVWVGEGVRLDGLGLGAVRLVGLGLGGGKIAL